MKNYIGVIAVKAEPSKQDEQLGYMVEFGNGHQQFVNKSDFESTFLQINLPDKLTEEDIHRFVDASEMQTHTIGNKTTVVQATLPNGWIEVESSSCVDPINYNQQFGEKYCKKHIEEKMWKFLGFVLQWAVAGLRK